MMYENPKKEKTKLMKVMSIEQANDFYQFAKNQHSTNVKESRVIKRVLENANSQDDLSVFWASNPERQLITKETRDEFWRKFDEAYSTLTPTQQRRFSLYAKNPKNYTYAHIARMEGVDASTVKESIESAQKKLQKIFL